MQSEFWHQFLFFFILVYFFVTVDSSKRGSVENLWTINILTVADSSSVWRNGLFWQDWPTQNYLSTKVDCFLIKTTPSSHQFSMLLLTVAGLWCPSSLGSAAALQLQLGQFWQERHDPQSNGMTEIHFDFVFA